MEFDHSSDDSVDQRKLKLSIKQEIDDCQQLTSKAKTKEESDLNHSNQNSHHHDCSIANECNINEVKLKPSKSFWLMAKKILIGSDEIADLRLIILRSQTKEIMVYPFPACVYKYCEDGQKEISASFIDFKIKLPICSHEELLEELKIFKIMRPKSSQDASKLTEDTKIEIVSTKNGLYAKRMNPEKCTPYYMKLKELNLRKGVVFKNILRKIKKDFRAHFNEITSYTVLKKTHGASVLMKCIEDYLVQALNLKFNKELGFAMGIFANSKDIQLLFKQSHVNLEESKTGEEISK